MVQNMQQLVSYSTVILNKLCVFVGFKCSKCSTMHGMENVT